MIGNLAYKLFGSSNDRAIRQLGRAVAAINALEVDIKALSDENLKAKTGEFRDRLKNGASLDDILPEAFAVAREAAWRTLGQRPFDVQLMGGIVLHDGQIAEMKTGEGKTLVATLPVYLNALEGRGVHVVTVNDYLASRDANWMRPVYEFLGLSVGCIQANMPDDDRRKAYAADVTYGTNNEFGFDYLRDNMKFSLENMVQRKFNFAIVDEVDSILIDEARTPLIISGPAQDSSELYKAVNAVMPGLENEDYDLDEKARNVTYTESGIEHLEQLLKETGLLKDGGLYDAQNISLVHHANQALRAHTLFQRDKDYIVKDDKVIIIDEFTGRMMEGRRYSEGLHQALEAKEGVSIQNENQTLASITFQNYFRLYPKLSGMTGTALTEAAEFDQIYSLGVVAIPTNKPMVRNDYDDEIYLTMEEKYDAIVTLIKECQAHDQPVLVGTTSIEKSELLSKRLKKEKITHNVLNARYHEQEAHIIAQAGRPGAVTIATNMAGRGTDIQLGGNLDMRISGEVPDTLPENERQKKIVSIQKEIKEAHDRVLEQGGLYVIGTERHESRRIDNQLRGRSGRQGDPGASKFFLSLEDDLMRIFGPHIDAIMSRVGQKLGMKKGEAIRHPWINKAIERAQAKVEAQHFEIRKNLLKFDNVMNDQRKVVYEQRQEIMAANDVSEIVIDMRHEMIEDLVTRCVPFNSYVDKWDLDTLKSETHRLLNLEAPIDTWAQEEGIAETELIERLVAESDKKMAEKSANIGPEIFRQLEKAILLQLLDQIWKEHLLNLDHMRQGIVLRAYGQKDPLNEYKSEAFAMFEGMLVHLREKVTEALSLIEFHGGQASLGSLLPKAPQEMHETRVDPALKGKQLKPPGVPDGEHVPSYADGKPMPYVAPDFNPEDPSTWAKTPRNAPCPCGSGKKFKHCHGRSV